jgi:kynurenine formamidase
LKATFIVNRQSYSIDLSEPLDISIPLSASSQNPIAWNLSRPEIEPVVMGEWIGSVDQGAAVNFNTIRFNPHAHGTHTECVGHITKEFHSINETLNRYFFLAELITVTPEPENGDMLISKEQLEGLLNGKKPEAVVIRTLPNKVSKLNFKYSNTNWPYMDAAAAGFLAKLGVEHILIDLPSVDKERDEGKLLAHKAFWNYPKAIRFQATITELIYVADRIEDGNYLLNLQTAPFVNDAAPSRPVLYKIENK